MSNDRRISLSLIYNYVWHFLEADNDDQWQSTRRALSDERRDARDRREAQVTPNVDQECQCLVLSKSGQNIES